MQEKTFEILCKKNQWFIYWESTLESAQPSVFVVVAVFFFIFILMMCLSTL